MGLPPDFPPPPPPPLTEEAHTCGSCVIAVGLKNSPHFPPKGVGISVGFNFEFRTWSVLSWGFLHGFTVPFMFPSINSLYFQALCINWPLLGQVLIVNLSILNHFNYQWNFNYKSGLIELFLFQTTLTHIVEGVLPVQLKLDAFIFLTNKIELIASIEFDWFEWVQ